LTLPNLLIGLIASSLIAALASQRGSLALTGALGAVLVGTLIFVGGGAGWAALLIAFFVTSSALSHFHAGAKESLADKFQKGHRRDLGQVLANGGWGALLALAFGLYPSPLLFVAFSGAMATVNADTWATELGVLSEQSPRLITNGRTVAVGTSGGVTTLGTGVALSGALLIGVLAYGVVFLVPQSLPPATGSLSQLLFPILLGIAGLFGSLFDSFLGATVQAIYFCDYDHKETESARHRCGHETRFVRGWRWLDNDGVNFFSSIVGSGIAVALYLALTSIT
jgi:uncharacterized protein (TIGR00297 family)